VQQFLDRPVVRDFLRFAMVGALATAVHYSVLLAMTELGGANPVIATICGFFVGAVVSYVLNRRYTFANKPAFSRGLAKFLLVIGIGAVINAGIVAAFVESGIHYMTGQVIATGIVLIWNFGAARIFVFR
jgi:putative flippase GtrA